MALKRPVRLSAAKAATPISRKRVVAPAEPPPPRSIGIKYRVPIEGESRDETQPELARKESSHIQKCTQALVSIELRMLLRSEAAAELELSMPWVRARVFVRSSRAGARLGEGDGKNDRDTPEPHYPLFSRSKRVSGTARESLWLLALGMSP